MKVVENLRADVKDIADTARGIFTRHRESLRGRMPATSKIIRR